MNEATQKSLSQSNTAKIVYYLYLAGFVTGGVTGIIGVVMAYLNKDDAPDWLKSHYQFQISTFWKGAVFMILGVLLALVIVGYVILLFWFIWLIVRSVKGLKLLDQQEAHPKPKGWMF